ncbi:bifunctional phosphatase PAP2/diacylglycerol kinase family protein [Nocardiopsis sp. NRRL B-16309]|uniref:bifunctional phosphatase PAP2/diacylglycerol kinase family protein n=1 Tax=Nocardiopsis sp. NRRL B-16309 TaxID=1519494 RepID=UPI0006AF94D2|nr:bifunctional phosphatase PAP2/diacylglycerol kinase family protein [Nocardiopsis sp. NRRL B-16309]KOX12414.1 PA-phosphatase [Nocardiopsis sp. NRRL B-16309]
MRLRPSRLLSRADRYLYDKVTALGPPALDPVTPRFVQATDHMAPWLLVSATLAAVGGPRLRRTALRAITAAGAANATSFVVKNLVTRSRPDSSRVPRARRPYRAYGNSSFPSGHTAAAAAFAGGIAADAPRPLSAVVWGIAGAVALSRVHSGVHYPGDVAGGLVIGTAAAVLSRAVLPARPELVSGARTVPEGSAGGDPEGSGVTVVVNPRSAGTGIGGPGFGATADRVTRSLPKARIVPLTPDDDMAAVMDEAARTSRILVVSGGDGTANAGARAALEHDRPLLILPTGTLNNFARTLGLTSVEAALRAYGSGHLARVDVGEADGRVFLNTATFGSHPRLVRRRDRWAPRIGKWPAFGLALWRDLRDVEPTPTRIDGRPTRVWWAFVGNCRYRTHGRVPAMRERLDDGRLDVRVLAAARTYPRWRALTDILFERSRGGDGYSSRLATELTLSLPPGHRHISVDGEVWECGETVRFTKRPAALRVIVAATP